MLCAETIGGTTPASEAPETAFHDDRRPRNRMHLNVQEAPSFA